MSDKFYGWLLGVPYCAIVLLIGYGMSLGPFPTLPAPPPSPVAEAPEGPRCTPIYPRGFKVDKGTKKRPLKICGGDLQATWRGCTSRWST